MGPHARRSALVRIAPLAIALFAAHGASAQPAPPAAPPARAPAHRPPPAAPAPPAPSVALPPAETAAPPALRKLEPPPPIGTRCKDLAAIVLDQRRTRAVGGGGSPAAPSLDQQELDGMHVRCFDAAKSGLTSGAVDIGTEVLRSVAQVVLDRAMRSAWTVLEKELREAARCDVPAPAAGAAGAPSTGLRFPAMCHVLGTVAVQDLVSSPVVLIDAFVSDLLQGVLLDPAHAWMAPPLLDDAVREAAARWSQGGADGLTSAFRHVIGQRLREDVAKPTCDALTGAPDKAMWVAGMCLVEVQQPAKFETCSVDDWADQCTDAPTKQRIEQLWSIFGRVLGAGSKPALADLGALVFTSADIHVDTLSGLPDDKKQAAHEYIQATKSMILGIAAKDWIQTSSGAIRALRVVSAANDLCTEPVTTGGAPVPPASAACVAASAERDRTERLVTLLAAVGNYAETLGTPGKDGASARDKIIEDLVDRMVNRTHRRAGAVVSLGGDIALLGGARTDFKTGAQLAFPVQLGLGVGLQTYGVNDAGFHAMVSILDLGQYVTTGAGGLTVASPKVESSVMLGLTLGGWFALRETPIYAGVYGGMSPFVRTSADAMTYELGAVTGMYVPLLDFN
jgi:hypothetical protein